MTTPPADYTPGSVHALLVSPDGEMKVAQLTPSLSTYQRVVGAFVAIYYPDLRWHVYCHEATSLNVHTDVPGNTIATDLAQWADPSWKRLIRGTAVLVGTGRNGQDLDVPADVLRHLRGEL
ncbi:DUF3846 domain-containing protein [Flindersiella endophytica]